MELFSSAISQFNIQDALNAMSSFVMESPVEQTTYKFVQRTNARAGNNQRRRTDSQKNAFMQPLMNSNMMSAEEALRRMNLEDRRKEQRRRMSAAASKYIGSGSYQVGNNFESSELNPRVYIEELIIVFEFISAVY